MLTWLRENRDGAYWRARLGAASRDDPGYDRIECPMMLVAGWADGYRNNSFRTVAALAEAGVPHRLLAGPWAHADPATAMPGSADRPRVRDGRRGSTGGCGAPAAHEDRRVDVFVRTSTRPEPDLDLHEGRWVSDLAVRTCR